MSASAASIEEQLRSCLERADPALALPAVEAVQAARMARKAALELQREVEAQQAHAWLARHLFHLGEIRQALAEAQDLLRNLPEDGQEQLRAEGMRIAALAASELGEFELAQGIADGLMQLSASTRDPGIALASAFALGVFFVRIGNSWQAVRILSEALELHGEAGPTGQVVTVANALTAACTGMAYLMRNTSDGERRRVLGLGSQAADLALGRLRERPNETYQAVLQTNLAEVVLELGDPGRAHDMLRQSLSSARAHSLQELAVFVQSLMAKALVELGRHEDALAAVNTALSEVTPMTTAPVLGRVHEAAHRVFRSLGRWEQALLHLEQAELIERSALVHNLQRQSEILVSRSEALQARATADRARSEAVEQRNLAAKMTADAQTDALTGLGNRRHLEAALERLWPKLAHDHSDVVVAQIDIDHFKRVNDEYGHASGDAVLAHLAQILREATRSGDVVVRQGGEEFVLLLPGTGATGALEVCERLRSAVESSQIPLSAVTTLRVTISIGLASAPPWDFTTLMQRADEALYRAKHNGRNRVEFWTPNP